MTSATANRSTITLNGAAAFDLDPADQELSHRESQEGADHVEREDPPALRRLCLDVEPALGRDKDTGASESNDRAQDEPGQWSDPEWHRRSRCYDQASEGRIGADVPYPLDDLSAAHRAQREAGEIGAEHETGKSRAEILALPPATR